MLKVDRLILGVRRRGEIAVKNVIIAIAAARLQCAIVKTGATNLDASTLRQFAYTTIRFAGCTVARQREGGYRFAEQIVLIGFEPSHYVRNCVHLNPLPLTENFPVKRMSVKRIQTFRP
jgi:hypothetical protein